MSEHTHPDGLRPLAVWSRSAVVAVVGGVLAYVVSLLLGSPLLPSMLTTFVILPLFFASVVAHKLPPVRSIFVRRRLDGQPRFPIGSGADDEDNRI